MEGVIPLLDRNSNGGIVKGKLGSEHIEHWIGNNTLGSDEGPWHTLMQKDSSLGRGVNEAFGKICSQFEQNTHLDIEEKLDKALFHGNPSFAGMTNAGVIKKGSLTKRFTAEIEKSERISLEAKYQTNVLLSAYMEIYRYLEDDQGIRNRGIGDLMDRMNTERFPIQ